MLSSALGLDHANPVNYDHPLYLGGQYSSWHIAHPSLTGNQKCRDLTQNQDWNVGVHGTYTAFTPPSATVGLNPTNRPNAFGEFRFAGGSTACITDSSQTWVNSVMCWFKVASFGNYWPLFSWGGTNFKVYTNQTTGEVHLRYNGTGIDTLVPALNTWYHIAFVARADSTVRIFFNGRFYTVKAASLLASGAASLIIGNDTTLTWNGAIDDFRASKIAWPDDYVWQAYVNSAQGCPSLLNRVGHRWWKSAASVSSGNRRRRILY